MKLKAVFIAILLSLILGLNSNAQQDDILFSINGEQENKAKHFLVDDDAIPGGIIKSYWLYLPVDYDKSKKYPVILFLHGGDVTQKKAITVKMLGPAKNAFSENQELKQLIGHTFIIINPHLMASKPREQVQWYDNIDAIDYIIESVMMKYNGDRKDSI